MYCPSCGAEMPDDVLVCTGCGWREQVAQIEDDVAMRILLPIGRSFYAIAAGYFGLFSVILFPAPFALLFGILGLRDIKRNPEKGGRGRAIFGVVMGAVFSLLLLVLVASMVIAAMSS